MSSLLALTLSRAAPLSQLAADADALDVLNHQLDSLCASGAPIMNRYVLLGRSARRVGGEKRAWIVIAQRTDSSRLTMRTLAGQGVVAFARHVHHDKQYALKFFLDHDAFETELALYSNPAIQRTVLAPVDDIVDASTDPPPPAFRALGRCALCFAVQARLRRAAPASGLCARALSLAA